MIDYGGGGELYLNRYYNMSYDNLKKMLKN